MKTKNRIVILSGFNAHSVNCSDQTIVVIDALIKSDSFPFNRVGLDQTDAESASVKSRTGFSMANSALSIPK